VVVQCSLHAPTTLEVMSAEAAEAEVAAVVVAQVHVALGVVQAEEVTVRSPSLAERIQIDRAMRGLSFSVISSVSTAMKRGI
jgi:hypothetical protein